MRERMFIGNINMVLEKIITTHHLAGELTQLKGLQVSLELYATNIVFFWWVVFVVMCIFLLSMCVGEYIDQKKEN